MKSPIKRIMLTALLNLLWLVSCNFYVESPKNQMVTPVNVAKNDGIADIHLEIQPVIAATPVDAEIAVNHIRALLGDTQIQLQFLNEFSNVNAGLRKVYIFKDALGGEYQVDASTYQVIEFMRNPPLNPALNKSSAEIKSLAEAFAAQHSSAFIRYITTLSYMEGVKGKYYFFRWENRNADGQMIPLLQIRMDSNGQIVSYINTLDILNK